MGEGVNRWIVEQNIARLLRLLEQTTDAEQRCQLKQILTDERQRLRDLDRGDTDD